MAPTYTVFPIESPVSSSHLAAYKKLRLTSIQTDPNAFSSNYAREVAFSEDVWRDRLDSAFKQSFVVSALDDDGCEPSHERRDIYRDTSDSAGRGEWIGTATVIGHTGMAPFLGPFKDAGVGDNWEVCGLSAMWVHPAHRGKGVGTRLVKACLEWARTTVDVRPSSGTSEHLEKVVVLIVHDDNVAGRALYSRMGFSDLESVSAGEGDRWMWVKV